VIERGELRFYGDPDLNPVLDISAVHTVRQFTSAAGLRNDVRIRVHLLGTLVQPRLRLESADSLALSESDLISYLVVGAPSFEAGVLFNNPGSTYSSLLLGAAGSILASRLSGGLFDYVQIQTSTQTGAQAQSRAGLFAGAQFGVGKQINDRTFVSLTAGLCQFRQIFSSSGGQPSPADIATTIGVTIEHRLGNGYGLSLSREPAFYKLLCGAGSYATGFNASDQQLGLDFFRAWRW
jgi:translocation and assembly module TamB